MKVLCVMKPRKIMQTENNSLLELNGKVVAMHSMKYMGEQRHNSTHS